MDDPLRGAAYDVVCPHCKKSFRGRLLAGGDPHHRGFKCPNCRLYVPFERADEPELLPGPEPA